MNIYQIILIALFFLVLSNLIWQIIRGTTVNKSPGRYRIVHYNSPLWDKEWYYIERKDKKYVNEWKEIYAITSRGIRCTVSVLGYLLHFKTEQEAKDYITNVLIPEETNPLVEKKDRTVISYHP